jgi:hypothetical protein
VDRGHSSSILMGFSTNLTGYRTFKLYLVIRLKVSMADQVFMYATTAGVMIGLAVLLFVVRGRRSKGVKATISGHEGDKGRKAKRYDSDGKPVYE